MTYYQRNLPHWHPAGKVIFLTWRLYGSLPRGIAIPSRALSGFSGTAIPGCAKSSTSAQWDKSFRIVDAELDRGARGPLWLADPEIANCAERAILRGAQLGRFELSAYVIMPNHVHLLLEPRAPLARITNSMKGAAARDANATLGRTGKPFWQDESFDHWIRNAAEFERIRQYIEWNPVSASLVAKPEDWKWSSASVQKKRFTETSPRTARNGCATHG